MERSVNNKHAVVIGGVNMDICGKPAAQPLMHDSNPGTVTLKPGGVARNIAHDLRILGMDVSLIAPVGGDVYGAAIMESCRALGIDMSMAPVLKDYRSSTYMYITDGSGDMLIAVNEMDIVRHITPEYLAGYIDEINKADAVIIDANLEPETIAYIAENCTAPLYADAVSAAKCARIKPVLSKLAAFKPNALEAEHLTGATDPVSAAEELLKAGVKRVFVSLGSGGMLACEGEDRFSVPPVEAKVVNTTGAGDSVVAAIVYAGANGLSVRAAADLAVRAGAITVASPETNAPELAELTIFI